MAEHGIEYTSSVARLRAEYVEMREQHFGFSDLYAAEWDRIMKAHDAEVAAAAWDEGYALDWTGGMSWDNPYRADEGDPR